MMSKIKVLVAKTDFNARWVH